MTDPSLQKMQTTPIPQEWVEVARQAGMPSSRAYDPIYVEFDLEAALTAVIPLVREDERNRIKASGCVIVPREATEAMVNNSEDVVVGCCLTMPEEKAEIWHAMIAASEEGE